MESMISKNTQLMFESDAIPYKRASTNMATIQWFTILFLCDVDDCYTHCYCIAHWVLQKCLQRNVTIMLQSYLSQINFA